MHGHPFRISLAPAVVASLLIAGSPPGARAAITPEARAVLERYLEATGGRAAWEAERSIRAKASLSLGPMQGGLESLNQRPDRSASVIRIGPFALSEGVIGGRAWRVDQNGKLQWQDGLDLEQAVSGTYFENEMWMAEDQAGSDVKQVAGEKEGKVRMDVIEVTPPVGKPRRFYFDAATGLLVKSTQRGDARTIRMTYSGYERIAGRLRPRDTRTQVGGMPMNDVSAHVESLWVNVESDSSAFLPPREEKRDYQFLGGVTTVKLPVRYGERHVWVRASVNGAPPEEFLLDTGASITVIDSAYAVKYGLGVEGELQGGGAGAEGTFRFSQVPSLRVPATEGQGVAVLDQKVAVIPLNRYIAPYFWREAAGILGYDFISRFVMTVDYEGQTLTLEEPEGWAYHGKGVEVPMSFAGGVPVVHGVADGIEGDFRLDVGSGSSVDLHTPFVAKHGLAGKVGRTVPTLGGGFGGTFTLLSCRMKSFTLGPFTVHEPLGALSQAATGAFASEDYAGNVGNRILQRFTCTFDYGRKRLFLAPNSRFEERDRFDRFGAVLAMRDGRVEVVNVVSGSPAEAARLRAGDVVLSLAGRPIDSYAADELRALFEDGVEGTKVKVEVLRGAKTRKLKVTLRSML